jgi:RNA chaperone Hfq
VHLSTEYEALCLSQLIKTQARVVIYLKNGVKLTGRIIAVSEDAIFLNDPAPKMIYRKIVSTIVPVSDLQV